MLIKERSGQDEAAIGEKLDALIRLIAVSVLGGKTGGEAIEVLLRAGLDNDLIADLGRDDIGHGSGQARGLPEEEVGK